MLALCPLLPVASIRDAAVGCGETNARVVGHVRTANFYAWNTKKEQLLEAGVKLDGIGATVAQDLEPEFATFSEDESLAFVSLQVWNNTHAS